MTHDTIKETFDDLSGNTPYKEHTERDFYFYAMGWHDCESTLPAKLNEGEQK